MEFLVLVHGAHVNSLGGHQGGRLVHPTQYVFECMKFGLEFFTEVPWAGARLLAEGILGVRAGLGVFA